MAAITEAVPDTAALNDAEIRPDTVEALEAQVLAYLNELASPSSALHQGFYGENGIQPRRLQTVHRPSDGHTLLVQDETRHPITQGDATVNVGAFKRRGAYLASLWARHHNPDLERFVTASAGNHALGVAAAAAALGVEAHIYCRSNISPVKAAKLEALGAVLHRNEPGEDDTLERAMARAQMTAEEQTDDGKKPNHYIHPFDQVEVIAGQATVGLEMLQSLQERAAAGEFDLKSDPIEVLVQVGGGGLLSGVAIVFKQARDQGLIGDNVSVIGVQMENCDAGIRTLERLQAGKEPTDLFEHGELNTWSDGTAVAQVGELPLLVMQDEHYVQGFQRVSELEVAQAMYELTGVLKATVEPAGALSYAAAKKRAAAAPVRNYQGEVVNPVTTYVSVASGANTSKETCEHFRGLRDDEYYAKVAALAALVTVGELDFSAEPPAPKRSPRTLVWSSPAARDLAGTTQ